MLLVRITLVFQAYLKNQRWVGEPVLVLFTQTVAEKFSAELVRRAFVMHQMDVMAMNSVGAD